MKKLELLAPAGDLEKLKIAVDYGADAVYFAGEEFGLRAGAKNFTLDQLAEGVEYAHSRGRKAHMTLNIFAHNSDIDRLGNYLTQLSGLEIDAFIASDPGVIEEIKSRRPNGEIHLSTQANATNYRTVQFWHKQGVKRIVLARELSLKEISRIRQELPESLELEAFVQGAMCISYSGRCLLSSFMTGREANMGQCAHPCRWKYHLVEEQRPGVYYPVEEDDRGTYIMNSKDLCMIEHIPELCKAGVSSFKIEGRMKSVFYVATVVNAYRKALDAYAADPLSYQFQPEWLTELGKVSHRHFTTGFYHQKPGGEDQNYQTSNYIRDYEFVGLVKDYDPVTKLALVEQRNKIQQGDQVEVFGPGADFFIQRVDVLLNQEKEPISAAPHAQQQIHIQMDHPVKGKFMIRKEKTCEE